MLIYIYIYQYILTILTIFQIFSKLYTELDKVSEYKRLSMKCACKIRIISESMGGKFYPLPACCKGEWGPSKAQRLFAIEVTFYKKQSYN